MNQKLFYYGGIVISIIGLVLLLLINPMYFILLVIGVFCIYVGRSKSSNPKNNSSSEMPAPKPSFTPSNNENIDLPHKNVSEALHAYQKTEFLDVIDDHYLLSYEYHDVKIAMPSLGNTSLGDFLDFEQEPTNSYDNKAIKIMCGSNKIGYVYRGKMQDMINDFLKKELPIEARIDSINDDSASYGIAFYKDIKSFESISAVLVKTTKKDEFGNSRQDNLSCINKGDVLYSEYDYDTDTYLITDDCGNEVGELSKSVSEKLRSIADDKNYRVLCQENSVNDSLMYKCKVLIIL